MNNIVGINIKGGRFGNLTELKFFDCKENENAKCCLIYGRNGSGKSTISKGISYIKQQSSIKMEQWNNPIIEEAYFINRDGKRVEASNVDDIFIFNEDFIQKYVRIEEDGLNSIVMFGEEIEISDHKKKLEEKIEELKKRKEVIIAEVKKSDDCNNINSPLYYRNMIMKMLRDSGNWAERAQQIEAMSRKKAVNDQVLENIKKASSEKSKEDLIALFNEKIKWLKTLEDNNKQLLGEVYTISENIMNYDYNKANQYVKKVVEKPVLDEKGKKLVELAHDELKKRLNTYDDQNIVECPYCFQKLDDEYKKELVVIIEGILSNEIELYRNKLASFKVSPIVFDFEPFVELHSHGIVMEYIGIINNKINNNNDLIDHKANNPYGIIDNQLEDITTSVKKLNEKLECLRRERNEYNEKIRNIETLKQELHSINNQIAYIDTKDTFNLWEKLYQKNIENKKKLDKLNNEIYNNEDELKKVSAKLKNINIAVEAINRDLYNIFSSKERLSLEVEDNKYYILSRGRRVHPKNISVGERNILGLCYFFTLILEGMNSADEIKKDYLLVIDDPISSYDAENKIGVYNYLKYKIEKIIFENEISKILLLTHDIQTYLYLEKNLIKLRDRYKSKYNVKLKCNFYDLSYGKLDKDIVKKKKFYNEALRISYEYAVDYNSCADMYDIVIGNVMRQVAEAFFTFEYQCDIEEAIFKAEKQKILNKQQVEYFKNKIFKYVFNAESHMEGNIDMAYPNYNAWAQFSVKERQNLAKDFLCLIYLLNKVHVTSHLESDAIENIKQWCSSIGKD